MQMLHGWLDVIGVQRGLNWRNKCEWLQLVLELRCGERG